MSKNTLKRAAACILCTMLSAGAAAAQEKQERSASVNTAAELEFSLLRDAYVAAYQPLYIESERAGWEASTTGTDAAFARQRTAREALVVLHGDREVFAKLKRLREGGVVRDPGLLRELDVMYRTFLPRQADPEVLKRIVALESEVEQIFNTHRGMVRGASMTENDVRLVLAETRDGSAAEAAWKGYMEVGAKVDGRLRELVALRNRVARELGYSNYYSLSLALQEVDADELIRLFDELDELTRAPFAQLKARIDADRAAHFSISPAELRPWHFGDLFFQETLGGGADALNALFADRDLIKLARDYYAGLGLEVDDILARSDLFEKPGKDQHAFSADIDRAGDVRILCNMKPNLYWADTILHELGHAVYDKYIPESVPFVLRTPAHALTTEGVAIMMGALAKNQDWLTRALSLAPEQVEPAANAARAAARVEKLVFCRWAQVMTRFEQGMYSDPDQDLGRLWWELKRRYQLLEPPDDLVGADGRSRPDYGAKTHIVNEPVYYHNYMLGDLFACQLHDYIATAVLGGSDPDRESFYAKLEVGDYLRARVFAPGNRLPWKELVIRATGAPLSAKAFARRCLLEN